MKLSTCCIDRYSSNNAYSIGVCYRELTDTHITYRSTCNRTIHSGIWSPLNTGFREPVKVIIVKYTCSQVWISRDINPCESIAEYTRETKSVYCSQMPLHLMWLDCYPLKRQCSHFDEIFIIGCTESCHFDNFRCGQWWRFRQNEDISVSVSVMVLNNLSHAEWNIFVILKGLPQQPATFQNHGAI